MELIETLIEGVVVLRPRVFGDARGYFFESYSAFGGEGGVRAGQRVEVALRRGARLAFPEAAVCAVEAGARGERAGAGRCGGHPEGLPDVRAACGDGAGR